MKKKRLIQFSIRKLMFLILVLSLACVLFFKPNTMVSGFFGDLRAKRFTDAYAGTSTSFKTSVPMNDFESWMGSLHSWNLSDYDFGKYRFDDQWNICLVLDSLTGGERLVFEWENSWWKYKHSEAHFNNIDTKTGEKNQVFTE